ncbi:MAG: hypothetical protein CL573_00885 [Alphaproteobacteria bacterium]|nr:hypothetical protein [Alphaproteobacteria bacterium]|tara:strand:- start:212 stop:544 length:333 start_codon:yes stop_codon:yes gene_type:complete
MHYNEALADKQGLSEAQREALDVVYEELFSVLARPTMRVPNPKDVQAVVTGFEYVLQALWGFSLDSKFHRYHLEIAGCTCPIYDNYDRIGHTKQRVINGTCPFHGFSDEG